MLRRTVTLVPTATMSVFTLMATGSPAQAAPSTVTNATRFTDTDGNVVHADGGGAIKVGSSCYWFGENRNADNTFKAVSVYRSTDLSTWEIRNDVLTQASSSELAVAKDNSAADSAVALQYTCVGGLNQQWRLQGAGDGYVRVLAQHSGKCLDVANNSTADGAFANQYRCTTGTNQQWRFHDQGNGHYRLVARHSGKCLDVKDASTANGARLIQWTCGTGVNQQFQRRTV